MANYVSYEIVWAPAEAGAEEGRSQPGSGLPHRLSDRALEQAHRLAGMALRKISLHPSHHLYKVGRNWIELPQLVGYQAYVTLSVERSDRRSVPAIAAIVQRLGCVLMPLDGDLAMPLKPGDLLLDLMRRSASA